MDTIAQRMERLERDNRRLRQFALAIACGTLAVFLTGQTVPRPPTLEAQRLVLKDQRGAIRAVLGAVSDDEPFGLLVLDARGRIRGKLGVQEDGAPVLALADERGVDRVVLQPDTGLRVLGNGPSVTLGVTYGTEPALELRDKDGWTRASLALTSTNTAPVLKFLDARGNTRAWIGAMSDGKAQLLLMNRPQTGSPGESSRPAVAASATLEVDADGAMGLRFFRGGTIWKAP